MDWLATIKQIAPTVATAFLGPLGGVAVAAVGNLLGVSDATQDKIASVITQAQLTPDQVAQLKKLELEYKAKEQEIGVKYADLAFQDRDSARKANVAGGVQKYLFWMSIVLLVITIGTEVYVLFNGYPDKIPEIIVGRVLGLMDALCLLVANYWFGTSNSSAQKNELLVSK